MYFLNEFELTVLILLFGLVMFAAVWLTTRSKSTILSFLVADRKVSTWQAALSIAVSWVWAPAIFICSMQAYNKGLPGIFWFTAPNILCFFIFAPIAARLRSLMPNGFTLPEFISLRFVNNKATHLAFLIIFFGYQLGAIVINSLAGGILLHALSGINLNFAIIAMILIALSYSLLSGLKASILTDVIQMIMVLSIAFVLVPWCVNEGGGLTIIEKGLGGSSGEFRSLFNLDIAFSMGIPMTLGLIAGPISDQMFFQRAMAVDSKNIYKTFIFGGIIFAFVPVILSLLGFLAAGHALESGFIAKDPQIVGAEVITMFLPKVAVYAFVLMAFAGLCSTLDSAFCAISSLATVDVYKKYFNEKVKDAELLKIARYSMLALVSLGTAIALLQPKLLWVFLIYGALASAGLFPTILALYWNKLTANGAMLAVSSSLIIATPISIYANITENENLIVLAAILSVLIGLIVCLIDGFNNKSNKFDFASLRK